MVVSRSRHRRRVEVLLRRNPAVAILGARQVGKTTLAREILGRYAGPTAHYDLESPQDRRRLADPELALNERRGLVVLDEIQRFPDLFPVLRVLCDRPGTPCRFLILGSAGPELLGQSSESLAGRIAYHTLGGFALDEVPDGASSLWLRGGFPRSFLAGSEEESLDWRLSFIRTFLERDIAQLGIRVPGETLRRFWTMLAHYHGQVWNGAELARAFGVAATTVNRYLDLLTSALVLTRLPPWHENLAKRQVRAPKVFVADPGILHALLDITSHDDLASHPKVGASWEGFCLAEVVNRLGARPEECYFWATHGGAELDLLVVRGRRRLGFEIKRTAAPAVTRSMRSAAEDLHLDELVVIHAGEHSFPLGHRMRAVAMARLLRDVAPLP